MTLCDPMNCSTAGLPVYHQLPEFTQTHVHWVGGAIQPSHPLSSPSPPAPNPSQHQGLFQWVNSSHEVAKVLEAEWVWIGLGGWDGWKWTDFSKLHVQNKWLVGTHCITQGAHLGALWWPGWMGWGRGRQEEGPRRKRYMYTYSWFTLLFSGN